MSATAESQTELPYRTPDLPGVGGAIKRYDEDFVVEEIPRYEASGEGTHIYFTIEKRGLTTPDAIRQIARALTRNPNDIGYAGLKDAHGVTRQRLSIEHEPAERVEALDVPRLPITSVTRHGNKIKLGHLAGNRFAIKLRDAIASPISRAQAILNVLQSGGVPNYFGPQRFGVRGDNARIGRAVLAEDFDLALALMLGRPEAVDHGPVRRARELFDKGDLESAARAWPRGMNNPARVCRELVEHNGDAHKAWRAVDRSMRRLYLSATQSEMFNLVLKRRINELDRVRRGDVAWIHRNGACFLVEDETKEQPRSAAFEISPSGPLFGRKMKETQGDPGLIETETLASVGVDRDRLKKTTGVKLDGARRPLRVPLTELAITDGTDDRGPFLQIDFTLPPGSYATSVTREVCKS